MSLENKVIFISGTPCTGKTTLATELAKRLENDGFNCKFIKINDFAISNNFVDGEDPDKFYKVINIEKLDTALNEELDSFFDDNVTSDDENNDSKDNNEINNSVNDFNNEKINLCFEIIIGSKIFVKRKNRLLIGILENTIICFNLKTNRVSML